MDEFAEERAAAGMPAVPVELHRVPFFLEPWYVNQPDDFWETHYTRQTRKFGSVEVRLALIQTLALLDVMT